MGIAVGDDAHDLGICADLFGKILDAFTLGHGLGNALGIGIDAIGGDLLGIAVAVHIVVIGVDQLTDPAVDGQVTQLLTTVIDVHFAKCFLDRIGGGGNAGEHPQQHHDREKHRKDSFLHWFFTSNLIDLSECGLHQISDWNKKAVCVFQHTAPQGLYLLVTSHGCNTPCTGRHPRSTHPMLRGSILREGRS